ncbi:hypothetical protein N480_00670 [Pseudoalteromonas luteoviolacea S2607]|nr:hypothetical protein N480_00670 [Pseudoalteromonas luteoviolacea S2607]
MLMKAIVLFDSYKLIAFHDITAKKFSKLSYRGWHK